MIKNNIPYLLVFSHELKSPLNTILNLAKLIELSLEEPNKEKIKKYTSIITSQVIFMKNYISNTIELDKIQSGKQNLVIEEFNIIEILHEVVEITKILIESKPIQIKTAFEEEELIVSSDLLKIKQILINIASNSAKFTKEGYILFSLSKLNNYVLIKVEDTGVGIPKEEQGYIFNPFFSDNFSHEKTYESSKLGLYITKELINILGGSISIESEYGKGTKVYISIPNK
ncbi:MAG: HAMP domain-containing histidine kinase [Thermodesulfovibrio sp.]|nr:HAMP domain-containing histidine kinase [Thermodesulfovibrio sp.]MCX7724823.1 HAMP domain-containing histidine kinase [Thermodesulfovibrio sp.]MDW7971644.1 HAMP domain-containing sensor histidine kinase [Thermodesulfovibrio sp.]